MKAKKALAEFLLGHEHQVAVVWGAPGTGKSSAVHLALRKYNMWPHTAEDLENHVKVGGKPPKISQTMRRLVRLKRPPGGRTEVFFLDHILVTCLYDPSEASAIVSFLLSEDFRLSGRKAIVEVDNLYARECRPLRRLLNPVRLKNKAKIVVGTSIRFWPVRDEQVRILLRQQGMVDPGQLARGVQVCHGDARQAMVFAKMEKTGLRCASAVDPRSSVFDACRSALAGDVANAQTAGDTRTLEALVQHNYPFQFVAEKSVWDAAGPSRQEEADALGQMAVLADAFSDLSAMPEAEGTAAFLQAARVVRRTSRPSDCSCKWPPNLMFRRDLREKQASLRTFRALTGATFDDLGTVCAEYAEKIRRQDARTLRWMFSHGIEQRPILERADAFL